MDRYPIAVVEQRAWVEVTPAEPCRFCGAVRQCLLRAGGDCVDCHQTASEWPMVDGGWLHRLDTVTMLDSSEPGATA